MFASSSYIDSRSSSLIILLENLSEAISASWNIFVAWGIVILRQTIETTFRKGYCKLDV